MKYLRKFNLNENYEDINDESNVTKVETKVGDRVTYGVDTMEVFDINPDNGTVKLVGVNPITGKIAPHYTTNLSAENFARQTTKIPNKDLKESFEEYDGEDENRPHIEPEDCECREEMEESGIEYTQEFHWDKDQGVWICEHCGTQQ